MASIENLVEQIADASLRARIAREVAELKKRRPWGLVFERHLPESNRMLVAPIRVGTAVWERRSTDPRRLVVRAIETDELVVVPEPPNTSAPADAPTERIARSDVLVEHDFAQPIFPSLTPIGDVRRGAADRPSHAVIQGENYHALEALLVAFERRFDVIYLDPPYNTGNRDWAYNNDYVDPNDTYRPSKWLAFMERRLKLARRLLKPDGVIVVTIDENEVHHLGMLLEQLFPDARIQMVTIVINPTGTSRDGLSRVDEQAFFVFFGEALPVPLADNFLTEERARKETGGIRWEWLLRGGGWYRQDRPALCYPVLLDPETQRIVGAGEPFSGDDETNRPVTIDGKMAAWPLRTDGRLGIWRVGREKLMSLVDKGFAYVSAQNPARGTWTLRYLMEGTVRDLETGKIEVLGRGNQGQVLVQLPELRGTAAKTVWFRSQHNAGGGGGTQLLTAFVGERGTFTYPKSVYAVRDTLDILTHDNPDALILDFFAGSGTTLHATMLLNAQDGGRRRCFLVTNNEVKAETAGKLNKAGHYRGDPEFEAAGVFEAACRPRVTAAVTGVRPDAKPVEGDYLGGRPYADGFEENVACFRLDYLDPGEVEFGLRFRELHSLLWLWTGGIGEIGDLDPRQPVGLPVSAPYAVLFDPSGMPTLLAHLAQRPDITHVFIVAESDEGFDQLSSELPLGPTSVCLWRDYLAPLRRPAR